MTQAIETALILRMKSDLSRIARRDGRAIAAVSRHANRLTREFGGVGNAAGRARREVRSLGRSFKTRGGAVVRGVGRSGLSTVATLLGGASVAQMAALAIRRENQQAMLQATSGKSAKEVRAVFKQFLKNQAKKGVTVDQQADLVQAMQDKGGLAPTAINQLDTLNDVMQGTKTNPRDLASLVASLKQVVGLLDKDLPQALGTLVVQGDAANVTLKESARELPELLSVYTTLFKRNGQETVAETNALFQGAAKAIGKPQVAATSLRTLMLNLVSNPKNFNELKDIGVIVEDETGRRNSFTDMLQRLSKELGGDTTKISAVAKRLRIGMETMALFLNFMGKGGLDFTASVQGMKGGKKELRAKAVVQQKTMSAQFAKRAADIEELDARMGVKAGLLNVMKAVNHLDSISQKREKEAKKRDTLVKGVISGNPQAVAEAKTLVKKGIAGDKFTNALLKGKIRQGVKDKVARGEELGFFDGRVLKEIQESNRLTREQMRNQAGKIPNTGNGRE